MHFILSVSIGLKLLAMLAITTPIANYTNAKMMRLVVILWCNFQPFICAIINNINLGQEVRLAILLMCFDTIVAMSILL